MAIYNINLSSHSAGGKKKPLKAPKKQNKDLDDVRGINSGSIILIGMLSRPLPCGSSDEPNRYGAAAVASCTIHYYLEKLLTRNIKTTK